MSRSALQAFSFNGTQFGGGFGNQYDAGRQVDSEELDGLQYETQHHEVQTKPAADISTRNLKGVLAALNGPSSNLALCDFPFKAMDGSNGLKMIFGKGASDGPGYRTGSVHPQRAMARGVMFMSGVSWSLGGKAELRLRAMGRTDPTTPTVDPVVPSLVALPAQPVPDFGFTLTSLTVNGDEIPTPDSFELNVDPKFEWEYLQGYTFPTDIVGAGVRGAGVITARLSIGEMDLGDGAGVVVAEFTRYASGGGFGADTVTFALNGAWSQEQGISAQRAGHASRDLLVRTRWDGTTRPLTTTLG